MQPTNLATSVVPNFDINLPIETKGDAIRFHGVDECYQGIGLENTGNELQRAMLDCCMLSAKSIYVWHPKPGKNHIVSLETDQSIRKILENEEIDIQPFVSGEKALKLILDNKTLPNPRELNTKSARKLDRNNIN
ncbi:MAG: hypothetical protein Q8K75_03520 [Chlamydiales bacterium]|nr:hypothetical protein [Chlamydiales bacterium]